MNEGHKAVLKRFHQKLAEDIMVTEDFLGEMYQVGIFERSMVDIIKSERTETDKVHKLLDLLPRRGPEAFEKFIKVLEKNYQWLAALLASAPVPKSVQGGGDAVSHKENGDTHRHSKVYSKEHDFSGLDGVDMDIKKLVAAFVHRQFGQSKRISEKDKKSVEKFVANQIQRERTRYQSLMSPSICSTPCRDIETPQDDVFRSTEIQDHLFKIHMKMETYVSDTITTTTTTIQGSSNGKDQCDNNRAQIYQAKLMPEDMDFQLIGKEVDALIRQYELLEAKINDSLAFFDTRVHNQPLASLVEKLVERCQGQEEEMAQDNQRISQLLTEIEGYCNDIDRLEKERVEHRKQIQAAYMDMAMLRQEKASMAEKIRKLEDRLSQMERDKTRDSNLLRLNLSVGNKGPNKGPRTTPRGLGNLAATYPASSSTNNATNANEDRRSTTRSSVRPNLGYPTFNRRHPPTVRYMSAAKKRTTGRDGGGNVSSSNKF